MKRTNTQSIGEIIREFFEENHQLQAKILEVRIKRAWEEVLGPAVMQYTRNLYIKDGVLFVSLSSAVLRSELTLYSDKLIKNLNDHAGATVIHKLVIR